MNSNYEAKQVTNSEYARYKQLQTAANKEMADKLNNAKLPELVTNEIAVTKTEPPTLSEILADAVELLDIARARVTFPNKHYGEIKDISDRLDAIRIDLQLEGK
ncbi:hypothetical protein PBI_ANJALI_24 [Arthrobacter phage Anjali]|uniref:Uncharacterized protein n=1 Tax=Arthrobacter phage Anjali TaxID=2484217 RepID=A0A3G3LXW7_9CAUD|nr:hypothetical protein HWB95_gp24 [Arthrobacter phage Anjali]AYQ98994.1 hypothetical protein PBI_ANJALI_24 [Arthrobacter phage Anjali]